MRTPDLHKVLLSAKNSWEILALLYGNKKKTNAKFSLQFLCTKLGLTSRGHLSDILKGRRPAKAALARKFCNLFGLQGLAREVYLTLVQIETEKRPDRQALLKKKIKSMRDQLRHGTQAPAGSPENRLLALRVFCSLGLFPQPPSRSLVKRFFVTVPPQHGWMQFSIS